MGLIAVIIGIVGALLGVYFREAIRRAYQQKTIATKLEAYLIDWIPDIVESEFSKLYSLGLIWQEELTTAFREKGIKGMEDVDSLYKGKLNELKSALKEENSDVQKSIYELYLLVQNMSEEQFSHNMQQISIAKNDFKDSENFVSDNEAATLSWYCANHIISIKSSMVSMFTYWEHLFLMLRCNDEFNFNELSDVLYEIIESGTKMSKNYVPLLKHTSLIRQKSIFDLMVNNLIS